MEIEGKYNIELNWPGDGRLFLNFWHSIAEDVIGEVKDGKILLRCYDENGEDLPHREVSFFEFVNIVKKSVLAANI